MLPDQIDYQPKTRLLFGQGSLLQVGDICKELGGNHILIVTDQGVVQAGHVDRVTDLLKTAGLTYAIFDQVKENPTTGIVDECVKLAQSENIDLIIGLGGGSSLDAAKGCNFIYTNGGQMQDYWGVGKASKPMLPLVAIPTTAGTGSECQKYALISDEKTHQKMACGDLKAAAKVAILEPELTLTQPRLVTISTGIDAMTHAVEAAVTKTRNHLSCMFSRESFCLTANHFIKVLKDPNNLEARAKMQLGAAYAGIAIENSMLGAAHAMANPLTAHYDVVHGQAVGLMLPLVIQYNAKDSQLLKEYASLTRYAGLASSSDSDDKALEKLITFFETILEICELPRCLEEYGAKRDNVSVLAEDASKQWTGTHNPIDVSTIDFELMYKSAFSFCDEKTIENKSVKSKTNV